MTRVLLTSFEPFGGGAVNSSLEVGRAVASRPPPGIDLDWVVLPVVADGCVERAWAHVEQAGPALVLALGQAGGAAAVRVESRAVNVNDFLIPDNAGRQPRRQRIVPGGPPAYRTTVPAEHVRRELGRRGIPADVSYSAGTYVCNHLYYGLLHRAALGGRPHRTVFVHLPLLPGQVGGRRLQPARSLDELTEGVRLVIAACVGAAHIPGP